MEDDNWNTVSVQNEEKEEQIEIEFEEPQEEQKPEVEIEKEEVKEEAVQEEAPELEGIKTKGAEKRIRKLIRERKERDEHIQALIQKMRN